MHDSQKYIFIFFPEEKTFLQFMDMNDDVLPKHAAELVLRK